MLKPDPTRYPGVVHTRVSGPEWMEADPAENESESNLSLAFDRPGELPADLAFDLQLQEILDQALLATAATGAVIGLASGEKMVCRATSGEKAPSAGVCLNTRSGLSGACVQSREMQLCDDTQTDIRVNAMVCRDLGIRSIVVLPVLDSENLRGILEVFASEPQAFSDSDLQTLQSLTDRISQILHEAVEGGTWVPAPDTLSSSSSDSSSSSLRITDSEEPVAAEPEAIPVSEQDQGASPRDYRTGALTVAVIALAVLLGWMVGRVGWSLAVNRVQPQLPVTSEPAQPAAQANPEPPAVPPRMEEPTRPAKSVRSTPAATAPTKTVAKRKPEPAAPVGGLVIYEHGKVVYRDPTGVTTHAEIDSGATSASIAPDSVAASSVQSSIQTAAQREEEPAVAASAASPVASAAENSYLLERVEPTYPEEAKQQHIHGPVVLNALVGVDGSVRKVAVISGNPLLVNAAADAVRQWRFRPHNLKGRPVEFETRITVNFQLP
ncbi:MAG: TonB family protein [Terriglobales bacterium]